jgi:hypothetical protein
MSERTDKSVPREGNDSYNWRISDQEVARLTERVFGVHISFPDTTGRRDNPLLQNRQNGNHESVDLGGKVLKGTDLGSKDIRLGTRGKSSKDRNWAER